MTEPRQRFIGKVHRRSCPTCGNYGFSRTGQDYLGRTEFRCHSCFQEWVAERGPRKGTGIDAIKEREIHD